MTQISRDDVLTLARLSSLQLTDDEISELMADLDAIVGYITQLSELNTEGAVPTYQVTGLQNVLRNDEIQQGVPRKDLIKLAPESAEEQIKVPKVL